MYDYYCNCEEMVGKWDTENKDYDIIKYCNFMRSKKNETIYFMNCKKCNKYIGIICFSVCKNCYGENQIFGEQNIFNWFQEYKKIISKNVKGNFTCKCCNKKDTRSQYWFAEELTFMKK